MTQEHLESRGETLPPTSELMSLVKTATNSRQSAVDAPVTRNSFHFCAPAGAFQTGGVLAKTYESLAVILAPELTQEVLATVAWQATRTMMVLPDARARLSDVPPVRSDRSRA